MTVRLIGIKIWGAQFKMGGGTISEGYKSEGGQWWKLKIL